MCKDFVAVAERFCSLIENHRVLTAGQLVSQAAPLLVSLYGEALALPDVPVHSDEAIPNSLPREAEREIEEQINSKLGHCYTYWEVFEPYEEPGAEDWAVQGNIGDDLASIYRELKDGLASHYVGNDADRREAIWYWKSGFAYHWGRHLASCLKAMHSLLFVQCIAAE